MGQTFTRVDLCTGAYLHLRMLYSVCELHPEYLDAATIAPLVAEAMPEYVKLITSVATHSLAELLYSTPPLLLQWMWHCHMLNPDAYAHDCVAAFGAVVPRIRPFLTREPALVPVADFVPSIDLVSACARQASFTRKSLMFRCVTRSTLRLLRTRYIRFVRIIAKHRSTSPPNMLFVPTIGIDLMWHTHMALFPCEYQLETKAVLGRPLHHNDDLEERQLEESFAYTTAVWMAEFREPYFSSETINIHRHKASRSSLVANTKSTTNNANNEPSTGGADAMQPALIAAIVIGSTYCGGYATQCASCAAVGMSMCGSSCGASGCGAGSSCSSGGGGGCGGGCGGG